MKIELSEHGCMGLYSEVLNFWGKYKIKKYTGLCSVFTVFVACTLQLVHLPSFQTLDPSKNPRCAPVYKEIPPLFSLILKMAWRPGFFL